MLRTAIFGNVTISETVRRFVEGKYNPAAVAAGGEAMEICAYFGEGTASDTDVPVISGTELIRSLRQKEIQILIVPKENAMGGFSLPWVLYSNGISLEDVYFSGRIDEMDFADEKDVLDFFTPILETKYLSYLEFHVADHCNLNCKACEHYSGLVKEEVFPVFSKFSKDFIRLHEMIDDIGVLRILGGEPLLNKEINSYMKLSRNLYPKARIYVVTNGMLLKTMPEEFYETLHACDIMLSISFYPPLEKKMPDITAYLDERKVAYLLTPLNTEFGKKQLLQPQPDDETIRAFYNCSQKMCNNFYDGKIAACFLPFTTKYFNRTFGKDLPEDGAIDIYDPTLSTRKLKEQLMLPFLRCRYCSTETEMIPWGVMTTPTVLGDWVKE